MSFQIVKKSEFKLTFISKAEIQVQEEFPKEKEEKEALIALPRRKNKENTTYFEIRRPSRSQSPS